MISKESDEKTIEVYETKEAAKILRISFRTLERWRLENKGPNYRKLGGRVVYLPEDLQEYLKKCKVNL